MIKTSFIIPKFDNNGKRYSTAIISKIESEVTEIAGGLTKTNAIGFWQDKNRRYIDRNNYYFTTCKANQYKAICQVLIKWKLILKQESIYSDAQKIKVNFL